MSSYLDQINHTGDIKTLPKEAYGPLAQEIRDFLIEKVSVTGGHLASNLGVVELTMGLHLALDLPEDKIVWDVGHQSYTHKILTGRKDAFDTLRCYEGLAGFPRRRESECDVFDTGHASTSISAALGLAKARDLKGGKETIVAVIGDGALTGGLAYEAMNNAARLNTNLIIVLNDNEQSISPNVGGISRYLEKIRTSTAYLDLRDRVYDSLKDRNPGAVSSIRKTKNSLKSMFVPGMLFENLGITYLGPFNGMDVNEVRAAIERAKNIRKAVVVHVMTRKGAGYEPAEHHPARFHGTAPFEIESGLPSRSSKVSYTDIFSTVMVKMGQRDPDVVAITAAMEDGTGLKRFHNIYPHRFYDVGIAEEHAVTFAAGLAAGGLKPVVAIYSTFLQRAYDEMVHDVCMQDLPVVFCVDRAGLVGADGETHQGVFDLSYLSSIPGMTVTAPKNKWELSDLIKFALQFGHPIAIRYPRGAVCDAMQEMRAPIEYGKSELICRGQGIRPLSPGETASRPSARTSEESDAADPGDGAAGEEGGILLYAVGSMVETALEVRELLRKEGWDPTIVNARFVRPFDTQMLEEELPRHRLLVTMEENVRSGGFGEHVEAWVLEHYPGQQVLRIAVPDEFVPQGSTEKLREVLGIDAKGAAQKILRVIKRDQEM